MIIVLVRIRVSLALLFLLAKSLNFSYFQDKILKQVNISDEVEKKTIASKYL